MRTDLLSIFALVMGEYLYVCMQEGNMGKAYFDEVTAVVVPA